MVPVRRLEMPLGVIAMGLVDALMNAHLGVPAIVLRNAQASQGGE